MVTRSNGGGTMTMLEKPKPEVKPKVVTMQLRNPDANRVHWAEDTIDNEFLNKRKSKSKSPH